MIPAKFRDRIRSIFSGQLMPTPPELPSIYEHIRSHAPPHGPGLLEGGETLPDDNHVRESHGWGWVGGALDGAFTRHGQPSAQEDLRRVERLHAATVRLSDHPGPAARAELIRLFHEGEARALLGPLLNRLEERPPRNQQRLYDEMKSLALSTGHRDVLKFAMMILSSFGSSEDSNLLETSAATRSSPSTPHLGFPTFTMPRVRGGSKWRGV